MPDETKRHPAKIAALSPAERTRLARILAMLGSPHDGERAAAGKLATAFIARHGLTWLGLTTLLGPRSDQPPGEHSPGAAMDRRRNPGGRWTGYCRRRRLPAGGALDCYG